MSISRLAPALLFLFALLLGISSPGVADEGAPLDLQYRYSLDTEKLLIANLAGTVHLEGHDGAAFEIEGTIHGKDAKPGILRAEISEGGGSARLAIRYPVDGQRKFIYPPMGRSSKTRLTVPLAKEKEDWLSWVLPGKGRDRVEIAGSGRGMEIWSDIKIKVPRDRFAGVHIGVGEIVAESVQANLLLDTQSGSVRSRGIDGELQVDTGSGDVEALDVAGDLHIDTGSGEVRIASCSGSTVFVDTGSGDVEVEDADCRSLRIDTGSGDVRAVSIRSDEASIDTGSGDVEVSFERLGAGPIRVDTGSGGVDLELPEDPSVDLVADTGSGGIRCDVSNARIRRDGRGELRLTVGGGEAKVRLDTGSGSIRISQRP